MILFVDDYSDNLTIFDTLQTRYELPLGSDAEFTCLATANDVNNLDIFYQRTDGNPLGDNTERPAHDRTTVDGRTTLHINGITEANDGEYECVVRDLVGGGALVLGRRHFTIVVTCKSVANDLENFKCIGIYVCITSLCCLDTHMITYVVIPV